MLKTVAQAEPRRGSAAAGAPLVLEVAGPAGAGKTTLAQALCRRDQRFSIGVPLRRASYPPFAASTLRLFLPVYLRRYRHTRWFTREELRAMIYLQAWLQALSRWPPPQGAVAILDHGPIYRLAWLQEFGPEMVRSRRFEQWSAAMLAQWSARLGLVLWLDAPDAVLMERIEARQRWHAVKGKASREVEQFLGRYRASYDRVLDRLTASGGPAVLRFDTQRVSLDQIVSSVLESRFLAS